MQTEMYSNGWSNKPIIKHHGVYTIYQLQLFLQRKTSEFWQVHVVSEETGVSFYMPSTETHKKEEL